MPTSFVTSSPMPLSHPVRLLALLPALACLGFAIHASIPGGPAPTVALLSLGFTTLWPGVLNRVDRLDAALPAPRSGRTSRWLAFAATSALVLWFNLAVSAEVIVGHTLALRALLALLGLALALTGHALLSAHVRCPSPRHTALAVTALLVGTTSAVMIWPAAAPSIPPLALVAGPALVLSILGLCRLLPSEPRLRGSTA